jgi:hypothetical protein
VAKNTTLIEVMTATMTELGLLAVSCGLRELILVG